MFFYANVLVTYKRVKRLAPATHDSSQESRNRDKRQRERAKERDRQSESNKHVLSNLES